MHEARECAYQAADVSWKAVMADLVVQTARAQRFFTTDALFDRLEALPNPPVTSETRALGGVMLRAAKAGICRKADKPYVPSNRKSCHTRPLAVWESLIYVA